MLKLRLKENEHLLVGKYKIIFQGFDNGKAVLTTVSDDDSDIKVLDNQKTKSMIFTMEKALKKND